MSRQRSCLEIRLINGPKAAELVSVAFGRFAVLSGSMETAPALRQIHALDHFFSVPAVLE